MEWEGICIETKFDPDSYNCEKTEFEISHLAIKVIKPAKSPLPITGTGYRSQFLKKEQVAEYGSVEAYVIAWLNYKAKSKEWQQHLKDRKQLSLF